MSGCCDFDGCCGSYVRPRRTKAEKHLSKVKNDLAQITLEQAAGAQAGKP